MMKPKLKTLLQKPLHRLVITKPPLHLRTLTSVPPSQHQNQATAASMNTISTNPFIFLLNLCKNIWSLRNIHALLIVHGQVNNTLCQIKLVSLYGLLGHIQSARQVFDQISHPDLFAYKAMLRWYFLNDLYEDVIGFYNCLRMCLQAVDNVIFSIVLKACSETRDVDEGRKVHCLVVKAGSPDGFVLTGLVDMYAKCGEVDSSREVFDEIVDPSVVCWTSMIGGYVQNGFAEEGLALFDRMRSTLVEGNQYTFGIVVKACAKLGALHQGKWVHGYVIKTGIELNSYLVTAVVDMYVKCGAVSDARVMLNELCIVDIVSWTAMIVGYTQGGYPNEALRLFTDKKWIDISPNSVTIASVFSACAQLNNSYVGRSVHSLGIKLGLEDAGVNNALIDMYAKCNMIGDAHYLFGTVSKKDVVTWNSLIYGCTQNGQCYEALRLFCRMRLEYWWPDAVTVVSVLSACASLGALQVGSSLHAFCTKAGLPSCNVRVGTELLNFYAKCGDLKSARLVFDGMEEKNTITWSAMIGGCGMQGDFSGSLALFNDMMKEKVKPSDATFTTIISACGHTGRVGEGWRHFNLMCRRYNFVPSKKHYVCMIDLLARAGRLEEALDFMEKMPIQPDASVFGAFLHGCSLHSRFDLGEVAVSRMLDLHPQDASYYVLMSKLYASHGRWSEAYHVMELMKTRDLSKSPGCSVVQMDLDRNLPPLGMASQSY
ncbi:hypothetical protein RJ639_002394 [Escallonia herrerae]|uniref:Pentatricopeptide repeat-containing protein n=1 Tax=Escallonia herrerae TaxID=1293975 RepID=A0AA88X9L4_9ASTE|nr:hypothetical protein RJ639_002394 [Escallonia herrerae]